MSEPTSPVRLITNGIPGLTYNIVDPDNQYQKFEIVLLQAPSGTDPRHPPNYKARLTNGGTVLEIDITVASVMSDTEMLLNQNVAWMKEASLYENQRQTRLGGLGPVIAQINTHFANLPWTTVWRVPLKEACDEIVGGYSITNFPPEHMHPASTPQFYPVIVEFKLKTVEQSVKKEAEINCALWLGSTFDHVSSGGAESTSGGNSRVKRSTAGKRKSA